MCLLSTHVFPIAHLRSSGRLGVFEGETLFHPALAVWLGDIEPGGEVGHIFEVCTGRVLALLPVLSTAQAA